MQFLSKTFRSEMLSRIYCKKNTRKTLFPLFSLILVIALLISCSGDSLEVSLTFLEKNHDTEWILSGPDLSVYIKINNDTDHLIEQWSYDKESDCYHYNSNIFNPGDYQILENTENYLVISCDAIFGDCEKMMFPNPNLKKF